jgi:hypothetical protein
MSIHEHLLNVAGKYKACQEARKWAAQYTTAQEVFDNCIRIDWLFWWCARLGQSQQVVKAAKEIASSVAHLKNRAAYAAYDAVAYAAYAADDAAAYAAAYAATHAAGAARKEQQDKNMQIARKYLTCPWHEGER